jgi:hypothetical protein
MSKVTFYLLLGTIFLIFNNIVSVKLEKVTSVASIVFFNFSSLNNLEIAVISLGLSYVFILT